MEYLIQNTDSVINILFCIIIGIAAAFTASVITRKTYGRFIEALLRCEAEEKECAKTLGELGVRCNFMLKRALSRKTVLSSLVSCDNQDLPIEERRFYLLPENQIKALGLFGSESLSPLTIVFSVALFVLILAICQYVIPAIIN